MSEISDKVAARLKGFPWWVGRTGTIELLSSEGIKSERFVVVKVDGQIPGWARIQFTDCPGGMWILKPNYVTFDD